MMVAGYATIVAATIVAGTEDLNRRLQLPIPYPLIIWTRVNVPVRHFHMFIRTAWKIRNEFSAYDQSNSHLPPIKLQNNTY
jgi:hypothetical protein